MALRRVNDFARIAICGLIASYEGAPTTLPDMRLFLVKRFKIEGFIVSGPPGALAEGARRSGRCRRGRKLT